MQSQIKFKVLAMCADSSVGWITRASRLGLKVTSRPSLFGREMFFVRSNDALLKFEQSPTKCTRLSISSDATHRIKIAQHLENSGIFSLANA